MYEYMLPLALALMSASLLVTLAGILSKKDREKYRFLHSMFHLPIAVVMFIGLLYYWISPLTETEGRITLFFIFILSVVAYPLSGRFERSQFQMYLHTLLELAAALSLLWFIA